MSDRTIRMLLAELDNEDPGLRTSAIETLRRYIEYDSSSLMGTNLVQRLVRIIKEDDDDLARTAALFAISQYAVYDIEQLSKEPSIVKILYNVAVNDPEEETRMQALVALNDIADNNPRLYVDYQDVVVFLINLREQADKGSERFAVAKILQFLYTSDVGKQLLKSALKELWDLDRNAVEELCAKSNWIDILTEFKAIA